MTQATFNKYALLNEKNNGEMYFLVSGEGICKP